MWLCLSCLSSWWLLTAGSEEWHSEGTSGAEEELPELQVCSGQVHNPRGSLGAAGGRQGCSLGGILGAHTPSGRDEALRVRLWLLPALSQPRSQGLLFQNKDLVSAVLRAPSGVLGNASAGGFPQCLSTRPHEVENTEFSRVLRAEHPPCSLHVFTLNLGAV